MRFDGDSLIKGVLEAVRSPRGDPKKKKKKTSEKRGRGSGGGKPSSIGGINSSGRGKGVP